MSQITASRMYQTKLFRNMQLYKQKIAAAKKGHELLKRKADALKKKFK
jgi:vacuolar-type H+-ATPase subunit D/Vma8